VPMITKKFKAEYAKLNPKQKEAVDTIEGPVMVIAGPGTGKTQVLTLRIANILLKTDIAPENILALTFTDAAASNMRKRLSSIIGVSAYRVPIETFHSFCNNVIKNYPEYFPKIIGSGNITEIESLAILEELIEKIDLDLLRPWGEPMHYIKDISQKIEELKREGLSPETFAEIIKNEEKKFKARDDLYHEKGQYKGKMKGEHKTFERQLIKNKELAFVYKKYQEILHKKRLYDYSDMIMEVLETLRKNEDLKLILQESYQYILIDEHQDTNNAQNKVLEKLSDFYKTPNLFIVGDEKQAIFRFQGASVENFSYFKKLYPKASFIEFKENYRSGQNILDAAHSLLPSKFPLVSSLAKKSEIISVASFSKKNYEFYFVAERIKKLIEKKVLPREIAVIYRSNKEAFAVADMLAKLGVPYIIESEEDLLSEKFVRKILILLLAIYHYGESEFLTPALHLEEAGIDILEAYKIIFLANKNRISLYNLVSKSEIPEIKGFGLKIKSWAKESGSEHLSQFLEKVLRESGILDSMVASRDADSFLGIERLFEEGKRISTSRPGATLADFMEFIGIIQKHNLFIKRPKHGLGKGVRLMTAHKSKGLEFDYVHIINASENSFGPKNDRDHLPLLSSVYSLTGQDSNIDKESGSLDDERRLFYVCLTRAKKEVFISYSNTDENSKEILPSPFILEIRENRKQAVDTIKFEEKMAVNPLPMFKEQSGSSGTALDREFVSELWASHPMSVTALNNYLSCPWKYFYRNLLRIPSAPERHQIYGTAMHATIEDLWHYIKERKIDENFLINSYKRHLGILGILNERELSEALTRGEKALAGWFKWANPKMANPVIPEFNIPAVEMSEGIILSGKLDKVEIIGESAVFVTDYKTGKQRSRNDIEGKTRSGTGDMKRQLIFYKLLLNLYDDGKFNMQKGIIEFLEPDERGKYKREEFIIEDEEVAELKETIKKVAIEIISLSFWDKTCGDKACQYCGYRKLLK
jgi:DNA helicase II / ATP-dependent DNA helicase PcrA